MDSLRTALEDVLARAAFRTFSQGPVDVECVRELWAARRFGDIQERHSDPDAILVRTFRDNLSIDDVEVDPRRLDRLNGALEPLLAPFVQPATGGVGNGVFLLRGGQSRMMYPRVEEFGRLLVIVATRIGIDRVIELLGGWLQGEPLRIRQCAILDGVEIHSALDQAVHIAVSTMPAQCEDFPVSLPRFAFVGYEHFANRPMLSVEIEVEPALYRPDEDEDSHRTWKRPRYAGADERLREFDIGRFCDTLALVTDNYVGWLARWEDLGDLEAFMLISSGNLGSNPESSSRPVPIAQAHLNEAAALYGKRASMKGIDIAVSRWVKSKRRDALEDRLIDLRIALEATYTRGIRHELRFRTALHGAVHSGRTPAERKQYFKILKSAYDHASSVVHGGTLANEGETTEYLRLGQDICRRSLLRIIGEGILPEWTNRILTESQI